MNVQIGSNNVYVEYKMDGGRLVGQGSYGCVFTPAVQCENETTRREGVSKVVFGTDVYEKEMKANDKIKKVDPKGVFTNRLIHSCEVDSDELRAEQGFSKCKPRKRNPFYNLLYEHQGVDLAAFANTPFSMADRTLQTNILELCKGVQKLVAHEMVHYDIKHKNILKTDTKLVMIDFGMLMDMKDVFADKEKNLAQFTYPFYPPELKLFWAFALSVLKSFDVKAYLKKGKGSLHNLKRRLREHLRGDTAWIRNYDYMLSKLSKLKLTKAVMKDQVSEFVDRVVSQIAESIHTKDDFTMADLRELFRPFATKLDIFSLGTTLVYMYMKGNTDDLTATQNTELVRILLKMVHMNPYERYDAKALVKEYSAFVRTLPKQSVEKVKEVVSKRNEPIVPTPMTHAECMKYYRVVDLRQMAKQHKKPVSGTKDVLCARVLPFLTKNASMKTVKRGRKPKGKA